MPLVQKQKLTVGASITESYRFLTGHMPHFCRLIYGPLLLWVMVKLAEQILMREYDIHMDGKYLLHLFTAAFALVWYRQFLLGDDYGSYRLLLKTGFTGTQFTLKRFGRSIVRVVVITLALLIPAMIISIILLIYYQNRGLPFSDSVIRMIAIKSTFIIMLILSPILVRLSLYTAGFALGRSELGFKQVWKQTRGYTVTLWWITIRGFLPLSIYSYVINWLLHEAIRNTSVNYIISTLMIETLSGILTFMVLAIVVAANAEAFRILIGVRESDPDHTE
ncbi:MAG: hypothetical protein KAI89_11590 [Emcibacter sp.]|nr:hypothetical protein [Emcibacter sp.]